MTSDPALDEQRSMGIYRASNFHLNYIIRYLMTPPAAVVHRGLKVLHECDDEEEAIR